MSLPQGISHHQWKAVDVVRNSVLDVSVSLGIPAQLVKGTASALFGSDRIRSGTRVHVGFH